MSSPARCSASRSRSAPSTPCARRGRHTRRESNAYRPRLVQRMQQKATYFHAAASIANSAGIFHLTRAHDFASLPEVISWLERHWLDLHLTEKAA